MNKSKITQLLSALLIIVLVVGAFPLNAAVSAEASMASITGTYKILHANSGKYLEPFSYTTPGQSIVIKTERNDDLQLWEIAPAEGEWHKIINYKSKTALSVKGDKDEDGTWLTLAPYTGSSGQLWRFETGANGYRIVAKCAPTRPVEVGGGSTNDNSITDTWANDGVDYINMNWCFVDAVSDVVKVTGIVLARPSYLNDFYVGETHWFAAVIYPENATNKNLVFTSSDTSVATVDGYGHITGISPGRASIRVKTEDGGFTDFVYVNILAPVVPVTGVSLDRSSANLKVGETVTLTATVAPSDATDKSVSFSSSSTSIATVSSNGLVTAKAAGSATIAVKTADGGHTAICQVTVETESTGAILDLLPFENYIKGNVRSAKNVAGGHAVVIFGRVTCPNSTAFMRNINQIIDTYDLRSEVFPLFFDVDQPSDDVANYFFSNSLNNISAFTGGNSVMWSLLRDQGITSSITFPVVFYLDAGGANIVLSSTNFQNSSSILSNLSKLLGRNLEVTEQVAKPTINQAEISGGKRITITSATSGATIYYTTNGATPTTSSTRYSGAFDLPVASNATIKAIAVKSGMTNSEVASLVVTPNKYTVTVSSAGTGATGGGSYGQGETVNIKAGTPPTGKQFKNWTTASAGVTLANANSATTSFTMPTNNVTITANFENIQNIYNLGEETYSFKNYGDGDYPGHCFGMSVTSSGYYLGLLDMATIGENNNQALYSFGSNSIVRAPICHYQLKQGSYALDAIVAGGNWYKKGAYNIASDWAEVVNYVKNHAYDGKGALQIGYRRESQGGHAINFLYYSEVGGQPRIYAYDNNFPNAETYFYKDAQGLIRQAPYSTFSGAIDCIALRDVSKYFSNVWRFDATHVIYADRDMISVESASVYPMDGDIELGEHVMYEIPAHMDAVTIIPLVDDATFEYLDKAYSFGKISDETIGVLTLSTSDEGSLSQNPSFTIVQNPVETYTITATAGKGGTVSGGGTYDSGEQVTLTAKANNDYTFDGWYENGAKISGAGAAYTFKATANRELEARFDSKNDDDNFTRIRTYTRGMFTDVNENEWYGYNRDKNVANAYEYGLMSGYPGGTFQPMGNLTIAEAITMAARVHKIYHTGTEDFGTSAVWYQVYVDYAVANGIIRSSDFADYEKMATRAQMAYIFSRALPEGELGAINTVTSLPDVNSGTAYSGAIFTLYRAGVLTGNDDAGTFLPQNAITRAEAAAIITRVILPSMRIRKTFR